MVNAFQESWMHRSGERRAYDMLFLTPPGVLMSSFRHISRYLVSSRCHKTVTAARTDAVQPNQRPRSSTRCRESVKKKVALVVGYDGTNYHGFQRNRDVSTVSDVLEDALYRVGAISDDNVGHLEKIKWQVAARTDRGVCAAGNVISAKLLFNREEHHNGDSLKRTVARVNAMLPGHVQLFGIKHITGSFSARVNCGERWYEYLLPMSALRDNASLEEFREILRMFQGTHPFHNYTVGVDHSIPPRRQSVRYITEATCDVIPMRLPAGDLPCTEWVRMRVKGQSFMLHQIRKMVSMALLTHHGLVPDDAIGRSFSRHLLVNVPPAPSQGLFLDCCLFDGYNQRHGDRLPEPMTLDEYNDAREAFKADRILPSIARRSMDENALEIYFNTVDAHPPKF